MIFVAPTAGQIQNLCLSLALEDMITDPSEYDWDELEIDYGLIQDREDAFKIDFESDPSILMGMSCQLNLALNQVKELNQKSGKFRWFR